MEHDQYLKFINKLIKTKQLKEKTRLGYFHNNIELNSKFRKTNKIKEEFITISIELENKKLLLIEDLPLNFLLSHSIFIGDETKLFEAEHLETKKTYILEESLLKIYKQYFDENTIKKLEVKELFQKKYSLSFTQPNILTELKKYTKETKKITLDSIHIIKGNKIENFLPTIKAEHFKLITKMGLPLLRPLISDYFIKESNINIKDNNFLKKQFNIIFLREKIIDWEFHKINNEKLYKDVSTQFMIQINKEALLEKIETIENSYPNKKKIEKIILNSNDIIISQNNGLIPLPIWKAHREQEFIEIENTKEFLELTGLKFKLDAKMFQKLFVQSLNGDIGIYSNLFLKENLEKYIDKNYDEKILSFSNNQDLIIKLIQSENTVIISREDNLPKTQLIQLKKKIKSLIKLLILSSIDSNKIPNSYEPGNFLSDFYLNCIRKNKVILEEYSENPSQKNLLKETINIINQVVLCIKTLGFSLNEHYTIASYVYSVLKVYSYIDKETSFQLKKLFDSYFHKFKGIDIEKLEMNPEIENIVNDLIILQKISKKEETYISNLKDVDKYIPNSTQYFNDKLEYEKYIVPNTKKIKEIFPYTSSEIIKQIKKINPNELKTKIQIKGKEVELKKEYYLIYKKYKNYSLIQKNNFYTLYRIRKNKKSINFN